MVSGDDVLEVGRSLPRAYEQEVRGRRKLKVGAIVFTALSRDEADMGFGFPKAERDALVASDPDTFFLPPQSDMRFQWVCAHLVRLDRDEMRELVVDAWRMCTPKMLHDLPESPGPTAAAWSAIDAGDWEVLRPLLHPDLVWTDRDVVVEGRAEVIEHLRRGRTPRPPTEVELRDGLIHRWRRL